MISSKGSRKLSFSSKEKDSSKFGSSTNASEDNPNQANILKYEKELSEEIRNLLKSISNRDQVLSASRKAFQKLDRECKRAIYYSLRKILDKEKENFETKKMQLEKLDRSLQRVNIEADLNSFIESYRHEEGSLVLNSHALSLLSDLIPHTGQVNINSFNSSQQQQQSSTPISSSPNGSFSLPPTMDNLSLNNHNANHNNPVVVNPPPSTEKRSSLTSKIRNSLTGKSSSHHDDKEAKRRGIKLSSGSTSPHHQHGADAGHSITSPNPFSPQPTLQLFAEEYNKHLTNIFFAIEENNRSNTSTPRDSDHTTEGEESSLHSNNEKNGEDLHSHSNGGEDEGSFLRQNNSQTNSSKPLLRDETDKDPFAQKFTTTRRFSVNASDVKTLTKQEVTNIGTNETLRESVEWLCNNVRSMKGRETFISELNQFRSKKVRDNNEYSFVCPFIFC